MNNDDKIRSRFHVQLTGLEVIGLTYRDGKRWVFRVDYNGRQGYVKGDQCKSEQQAIATATQWQNTHLRGMLESWCYGVMTAND